MELTIIEYNPSTHDCKAITDKGAELTVDPFVGCAIECTDDNFKEVGQSLVGKRFEVNTLFFSTDGSLLPMENDFKLINQ